MLLLFVAVHEKFVSCIVVLPSQNAQVMKGYRLEVPPACPPVVVRIMKACWHKNPDKRPSFLLIATLLSQVAFEHQQ